jgi:ribonuclease E
MPRNQQAGGGAASDEPATGASDEATPAKRTRRRAAAAAPAADAAATEGVTEAGATPAARPRRRTKAAESSISGDSPTEAPEASVARKTAKSAKKATKAAKKSSPVVEAAPEAPAEPAAPARARGRKRAAKALPETVEPPAVREPGAAVPAGTGAAEPAAPPERVEAAPTKRSRAPQVAPPTAVFFIAPAEAPASPAAPARTERAERAERAERTERSDRSERAARASARSEPAAAEEPETGRTRRRRGRRAGEPADVAPEPVEPAAEEAPRRTAAQSGPDDDADDDDDSEAGRRRRRRGRRGRGRGKGGFDETDETEEATAAAEDDTEADDDGDAMTRRRRRRRRRGAGGEGESTAEDGVVTVVKIREPRSARDQVQGVTGSTRLEAKRQRRRDGREQRRTRPPILSESEFLARREAVDRVMVVRQRPDRTQIAVLEDGILVEHYVTRQSASTMVGNVYLGKVQNVLPSMEAAFVDIGRGRNAVLYAGEVNWDGSGLEGKARSIEQALKSGESVLVQVTKDPIGHKGARLTSHIALSGRHLVYVPNGHASGISRKLSDVERRRLRDVLKNLVPDGAGVIVRTAAEGAAEDDLARDVKRLQAQWDEIQARAADGGAPVLLSSEPDLVIRVVRDMFNEDFRELVVQGSEAYEEIEAYLSQVSPDLVQRVRLHPGGPADVFAEFRVDEQILKALDRKVYLPSGGHLVIDRTEAMTVIDVNTGKYTGAGGNLEETVTRNNLEAAEEIVRQLRLRDVGGIIVIDFIDMVLESNRDLVLRRLTECLGRDRTKHQVTEITSLGLVQMTRKRIGQGLLEAFSESCEHCKGRGVLIHTEPVAERARGGVAEKVRAVAASVRAASETASTANGSGGNGEGGGNGDDPELPEAADPNGGDLDDLVAAADADDGQGSTARRRARRGSTRRRTRP